jgi:hypothetical protein
MESDERRATMDAELEHVEESRRLRDEAGAFRRALRAKIEALKRSRERNWRMSRW